MFQINWSTTILTHHINFFHTELPISISNTFINSCIVCSSIFAMVRFGVVWVRVWSAPGVADLALYPLDMGPRTCAWAPLAWDRLARKHAYPNENCIACTFRVVRMHLNCMQTDIDCSLMFMIFLFVVGVVVVNDFLV